MSAPRDPYREFTRRFFDRWSPLYDLFAKPIGFAYARAVRAGAARPGARILDLCTGTGEIAIRCARAGAEVTAVDMTASMLGRARAKAGDLPIRFALMDARALAFDAGSFDAVILSFALHDMPRRARTEVLLEAARVSRDRVVVLDYDPPRRQPWRKMVLSLLALFETPYLTQFASHGARGALAAAGLAPARTTRPLRGFFAVHVVRRPKPSPPRRPKPQAPAPVRVPVGSPG